MRSPDALPCGEVVVYQAPEFQERLGLKPGLVRT